MSSNIQRNNRIPVGWQGGTHQPRASARGGQSRLKSYAGAPSGKPRLVRHISGRVLSGFTLVELMVVVVVLAILGGIGLPGFQSMVAQNRATSAANELLATLQFARSVAIAQSEPVTVRPRGGNWVAGWIVEMGKNSDLVVLRESPELRPSVSLTGVSQLRFSRTGTLVGGQDLTPFLVDSGTGATRSICMTLGGSSKVVRGGEEC